MSRGGDGGGTTFSPQLPLVTGVRRAGTGEPGRTGTATPPEGLKEVTDRKAGLDGRTTTR